MGVITYILAITKLHSEDIDRVQNQAHQRERRQRKIIRNKKEKKRKHKNQTQRGDIKKSKNREDMKIVKVTSRRYQIQGNQACR